MRILVGLGNPGEKYKNNRHNIGFMFIDFLAGSLDCRREFNKFNSSVHECNNPKILLAKPQTFMNRSGEAIRQLTKVYDLKSNDLIVVHDDLDIPLGKFKIQKGTGPQLHNGIESIENHLHTKDFWRVRIGVDNRTNPNGSRKQIDGETYVLQDFLEEENKFLIDLFPAIFNRLKENLGI